MQRAQRAELDSIRDRLRAKFGDDINEKRMQDLLKLAHYKMLSREIRLWRSPTSVLAMRPQRSVTMRSAISPSIAFFPVLFPLFLLCSIYACAVLRDMRNGGCINCCRGGCGLDEDKQRLCVPLSEVIVEGKGCLGCILRSPHAVFLKYRCFVPGKLMWTGRWLKAFSGESHEVL